MNNQSTLVTGPKLQQEIDMSKISNTMETHYYQLQFLDESGWNDQVGVRNAFLGSLRAKVGALTSRERIIKRTIIEKVVESGE